MIFIVVYLHNFLLHHQITCINPFFLDLGTSVPGTPPFAPFAPFAPFPPPTTLYTLCFIWSVTHFLCTERLWRWGGMSDGSLFFPFLFLFKPIFFLIRLLVYLIYHNFLLP
ncbi:hypothetical protein F4774DRAFT_181915 [Daldinia eschscholtzii]|nr:hypothetical protein F4774DRAFT_181915 [Daldinia eschscholtzii]